MDKIQEAKLLLYRNREKHIRDIEEKEAATNEAIRLRLESNPTSIGPANDLLRFLYILEHQYQSDDDNTRNKTREDLLEYLAQNRSPTPIAPSDPQPTPIPTDEPVTPQPTPQTIGPPVLPQPAPQTIGPPVLPQPAPQTIGPPVLPQLAPQTIGPAVLPQPAPQTIVPPFLPQPAPQTIVPPFLPQPTPLPIFGPGASQPIPAPMPAGNDPDQIKPDTLRNYQDLLFEAQGYENRYTTVSVQRKKQLAAPLKAIMNKLRKDTCITLTNELFEFLIGQEQKVTGQSIRISNDEERLLCLSMIASLIFNQLLGSDLTDIKTEIFLPLVGLLSENQQQKEFRIIFLERLHKKCPYTIPYYPERQPTMDDKQYFEALGYVEKKEGNQIRLETETEFLNRMSGLIRFFCKLLVRRGPPFDSNLSYAWKWMADVLNLSPRPNITAMVLRIFLDEAGQTMMKQYSTQFLKITQYVGSKFIPKLGKETGDDQIARLRLALDALSK